MMIPVQTPTTPARIRVLPKLNSLTGSPEQDRHETRQHAPIPAINKTIIINLNPSALAARTRLATIPSYCVPRQPAIADRFRKRNADRSRKTTIGPIEAAV